MSRKRAAEPIINPLDDLDRRDPVAANIVLETAGNYVINYIATYSEEIVGLFNNRTDNNVIVIPWERSLTPDRRLRAAGRANCIIPIGRNEDEVHWIFFDRQQREFNSYSLGMQRRGGHQFCQSHAIRLAFFPNARSTSSGNNSRDAYSGLIRDIWEPVFTTYDDVDRRIFRDAWALGIEPSEGGKPYPAASIANARAFLRQFNHTKLLDIMKSDLALVVAPTWA